MNAFKIAVVVVLLGTTAAGLGVAGSLIWGGVTVDNRDYVGDGAVLLAGVLAALATTLGVQSWAEQNELRRREERDRVESALLSFLMAQFSATATTSTMSTAEARARAVIAASPAVATALNQWNSAFDRVTSGLSPVGTSFELPTAGQAEMQAATVAVAQAIRNSRGGKKVDDAVVLRALFNG